MQALVRTSLSALRPQGPLPRLLPARALALQLAAGAAGAGFGAGALLLPLQPGPWPEPRAMQPPARWRQVLEAAGFGAAGCGAGGAATTGAGAGATYVIGCRSEHRKRQRSAKDDKQPGQKHLAI